MVPIDGPRTGFGHSDGHTGADPNVCLLGTRCATLRARCFPPIDVRGGGRRRLGRRGCPRRMSRPKPLTMRIEDGKRRLLKSVNRGEWTPVARLPAVRARYARFPSATLDRLRKGLAAGALQDRPHRKGANQRGIGAIRARPCQPSPSFRFKVKMSGSNALRPLTLFWE